MSTTALSKSAWRRQRATQRVSEVAAPVLLGILILAAWQSGLLNALSHTDEFTLPAPSRIVEVIGDNSAKIMVNVWATLIAALSGLALGSVIGYGIAMLASFFPRMGKAGLGIVAAFNAIPIVALAPVMTNWTKDVSDAADVRSMVAKALVVMIVCIAAMSMTAYRGLTDLKPFSIDLMKSFAAGKRMTFLKLRLPNSIPYVFTALKVSVPASIISALVAEYFAEFIIGVGRQIRENIVQAQFTTAWAYIAVACVMGLALYAILIAIEGIVYRRMGLDAKRTSRQ